MASRWNGCFGTLAGFAIVLSGLALCVPFDKASAAETQEQASSEHQESFQVAGLASAYLSGRFALESGDIPMAADQFARAVQVAPGNEELHRQLFTLRLANGDYEDAIIVAESLDAFDYVPDEALLLLAFDALKKGELETSRNHLEAASAQGLSGLAIPLVSSWLTYAEGDVEAALAQLEDDSESDGLGLVRNYHAASMRALNGDIEAAREQLRNIAPEDEPVPTRLMLQRAAIDAQADRDAALAFLAAQAAVDNGNIVRAIVEKRLDADGTLPAPPIGSVPEGMADVLMSLGRAVSDQRAIAQAMLFGRLAAFLAPEQGDVWVFLGELAVDDERPASALASLDQVDPQSPFAYESELVRATALRELERYEEATQVLEALADQRPERTDALVALGNLHSSNLDYADAAKVLERAVDRLETIENYHWRLFYSRGIAYERTKRWALAEPDFKKALELYPEQPFVLNYLGYSWVDQGMNLDEAKGMLRRAVELRPEDGFIVDSLGWAHYRLGEYEDAVTELERAIELEPGDPVINDHLGDAYWKVGREREARYQWERALIFEPEDDVVAAIEIKLRDGLIDDSNQG